MKVGYAILYDDGTLTISKKHTILQKPIYKDYGEFDDTDVPWAWGKDDNCFIIVQVWILDQVKSNCMKEWFSDCIDLTTLIDFQNLDVSDCKDFSCLFYECQALKDISSLKNWNVSSGKNFVWMFAYCYSLINLSALENWNVSSGEYFSCMFYRCKLSISISVLKNWNVSNGRNFDSMFAACSSLTDISALKNWQMSNGKDFRTMFGDCINLRKIQLPNTLNFLTFTMFDGSNENLQILWKDKIYTYDDLKEYQEF